MFMSILCAQHFLKPDRHILWVNDEGRYRMQHWNSWLDQASKSLPTDSTSTSTSISTLPWETRFADLIKKGKIEVI